MRVSLLLLIAAVTSTTSPVDGRYWLAGELLINNLRAQSPKFEGVASREYSYRDLNHDNVYEIIEAINHVEETSPGLLNTELAPAFELHQVYTYRGGKFQKNYKLFADYLEQRIAFYTFWKRQIQNPSLLSDDSQALIRENKAIFLQELDRLIGLLQKVPG